jgi:uncharacterized protein (TIGR02996 family)
MAKKKQTTADEEGLLRDICQRPEDDVPRLVYADWLEEHNQPERAEFIRVQCRLTRIDEYDPERPHLQWRERQLLTDARKKTWGELPVKPVKQRAFRRGFIDEVSLYASRFLERADELFAKVPLRTVRPMRIGPVWDELLASPHLLRLRGLALYNSHLSQKRSRALAASEQLAGLHELNLGANEPMGAAGFGAILGSRHLGNLRRLDLNTNRVGNDALAAFIGNDNFPHLRRLDLTVNNIGPEGVGHLARADWLSRLEHMDLSRNPLGDEGARRLVESGILAGHKKLQLGLIGLTTEGARALVNSPHLRELTELHLEELWFEDGDFLLAAAQSTRLDNVRELELWGSGARESSVVTTAGVKALVHSPLAARLRVLRLGPLLPEAFQTLLTAQSLSGLTWLDVFTRSNVGGEQVGLAGLLRSTTHLENLHYLEARANPLTDKDMEVIADCAHLAGLAELHLSRGTVTEAGVEAILASPHFTRLRRLTLPFDPSGPDDPILARLRARFGEGGYSGPFRSY